MTILAQSAEIADAAKAWGDQLHALAHGLLGMATLSRTTLGTLISPIHNRRPLKCTTGMKPRGLPPPPCSDASAHGYACVVLRQPTSIPGLILAMPCQIRL